MGGVFMGLGATSGRNGEQLHVDGLGAHRFRGDGRGIHETLFALEGFARADKPAGGVDCGGFGDGRHGDPPAVNCLPSWARAAWKNGLPLALWEDCLCLPAAFLFRLLRQPRGEGYTRGGGGAVGYSRALRAAPPVQGSVDSGCAQGADADGLLVELVEMRLQLRRRTGGG